MLNKPHSKLKHAYAIVRIDPPLSEADPEDHVSVVKVFISETDAEKEVARLNDVNSDKGCVYVLQITRLVE